MSGADWYTDDEIGYVMDTMDRKVSEVAEHLGRKDRSVYRMRRELKGGWSRTKAESWTQDEDEVLRMGYLTNVEMAKRLPGRSIQAVAVQRSKLGISTGMPTGTWRRPTSVGSRTMIARTCTLCGLLLPGHWFAWVAKDKCWAGTCTRCWNGRRKDNYYGEKDRIRSRQGRAALQKITASKATRNGLEYTEADQQILGDSTLTIFTKALKLGRTYSGVANALNRFGYTSKPDPSEPEMEQWVINNPNLSRLEAITASLRFEVESQGMKWEWDWDDEFSANQEQKVAA